MTRTYAIGLLTAIMGHEPYDSSVSKALDMAIAALREQEERSKKCPYCDVAKANEGVKNTVLWVKEPETNKWTMMGKKLLFCPMCGRKLEEV